MRKKEKHYIQRSGWLRAAVLGANDGIVSTASLMVGVAAANSSREAILLAGVTGLVSGAMSMAAGEFVSVSSQADTERADLIKERKEIREDRGSEQRELASLYVKRGLTPELAGKVAKQLMDHDALAAHARDELGITSQSKARPGRSALASAVSFSLGGGLPVLVFLVMPSPWVTPAIFAATLVLLAVLGGLAAHAGGASKLKAALRVLVWGGGSMILTSAVGSLFQQNP